MKLSSLSPAILEKVLGLEVSLDRRTIKQVLSVWNIWGTGQYILNKRIPLCRKILTLEKITYGFQKY